MLGSRKCLLSIKFDKHCKLFWSNFGKVYCRGLPKLFNVNIYEGRSKNFEPGYFPLYFWEENVTGLSNGFLLDIIKISCRLLVYFARYNILKEAGWTL